MSTILIQPVVIEHVRQAFIKIGFNSEVTPFFNQALYSHFKSKFDIIEEANRVTKILTRLNELSVEIALHKSELFEPKPLPVAKEKTPFGVFDLKAIQCLKYAQALRYNIDFYEVTEVTEAKGIDITTDQAKEAINLLNLMIDGFRLAIIECSAEWGMSKWNEGPGEF